MSVVEDQVDEFVVGGAVGDGWAPAADVDLTSAGLDGVKADRQGAHAEVMGDEGE
jgi:hypothetical protein